MKTDRFFELYEKLKASGRLREILDEDGHIIPSDAAIEKLSSKAPSLNASDAECAEHWRLLQARTMLDLMEKYQLEMN